MTPLVLTERDQQRLAAATQALLSPLAYSDADAWRREVCNQVRDLVEADMLSLLIPRDGKLDIFAEDFDPSIREYPAWIAQVAQPLGYFERLCTFGSATRPMLFGDMKAYYGTAYWNEYIKPQKAHDSLTVSVQVGPDRKLTHHAQFIANRDSPNKTRFDDKGVGLGRLLLPALQTGAVTWLRMSMARHAFATMVDTLTTGALVYDAEGTELHRNPVAARLLASDAVARGLTTLAGQMARSLARPSAGWGGTTPAMARSGRFVLRATRLCANLAGRESAILVTIETTDPASTAAGSLAMAPSAAEMLQARFALTRQQARVAVLLADRRSTAEIAEALFISHHTVRRHTEQVLERLGVARRTEVEAAVRQALGGASGDTARITSAES